MTDASALKPSKSKGLLRSTGVVAVLTFCSRILGFVRDMVIAHYFGAAGEVDAFIVAFKIPQFMRRLFAEGAFSQAFVPVLAEYREQLPQQARAKATFSKYNSECSLELIPRTKT